ncbi:DUF3592 domain-containing protein [Nocardia thraciensis]
MTSAWWLQRPRIARTAVVAAAGAVGFSLVLSILILSGTLENQPYRDAARTSATIYKINRSQSIAYVKYHFDVNGKSYVGQTRTTRLTGDPAVGDQLTVVYSKRNPYESMFDEPRTEEKPHRLYSVLMGSIGFGAGCAFIVWWLLRRFERGRPSPGGG